jgi:hypothetical protein
MHGWTFIQTNTWANGRMKSYVMKIMSINSWPCQTLFFTFNEAYFVQSEKFQFLISVNLAIYKGWVEKNRIRNTQSMILFNTERVLNMGQYLWFIIICVTDAWVDVHTDQHMSGRTDEITCVTLYYPITLEWHENKNCILAMCSVVYWSFARTRSV